MDTPINERDAEFFIKALEDVLEETLHLDVYDRLPYHYFNSCDEEYPTVNEDRCIRCFLLTRRGW